MAVVDNWIKNKETLDFTRENKMDKRKRWLLVLALVVMVLSSMACGDGTTVDNAADQTDDLVSEDVEDALGTLNELNCLLGLDSCVED